MVGPITSGNLGLGNEVLSDAEWHPSALYVVDLVRFRQMAAGVSRAPFSDIRIVKPGHSL